MNVREFGASAHPSNPSEPKALVLWAEEKTGHAQGLRSRNR